MPRLEQPVTRDTFRLGCTPIVNLFSQTAEPIRLSHTSTEYQVFPDIRRQNATEVYSIDSVTSVSPGSDDVIEFEPFYSFKHGVEREHQQAFWYAARKPSPQKVHRRLAFVNLDFRPTLPAVDTLIIHTTCSNRDLPGSCRSGATAVSSSSRERRRYRAFVVCASPLKLCARRYAGGTRWRIISHLGLNYLSLCDGSLEALKEILKIYDFADSSFVRQQINGIMLLTSKQVVGRPRSMPWNGFCRGLEVTVEFDEEKFVGGGVFLFAAVLENFFGLYTSLNSFTQLVAKSRQREEPLKRWPPRAGEQILL